MLRRPYTVKALPFSNASDEVDLVWYPALPAAPDLGFTSLMASQDWDADGQEWLPGGEVPGAAMPYNDQQQKPGALGARVCGTREDFADGCRKETGLPVVVFGGNGLPHCCPAVVAGDIGGTGLASGLVAHSPADNCPDAIELTDGASTWWLVAGAGAFFRVPVAIGDEWRFDVETVTRGALVRIWAPDCTLSEFIDEDFVGAPATAIVQGTATQVGDFILIVAPNVGPPVGGTDLYRVTATKL